MEDVTTRLSIPPAKPCIPSCKNITGSSHATCDNGICKCADPLYAYVEAGSLEGLLGGSSTDLSLQKPSGCYPNEDSVVRAAAALSEDGGKGVPVGAIVGGVVGGLALLSVIGAAVAFYLKGQRPKSYFIQPNEASGVGDNAAVQKNFFSKKWAVKREEVKEGKELIQTADATPSQPTPAERLASIAGMSKALLACGGLGKPEVRIPLKYGNHSIDRLDPRC